MPDDTKGEGKWLIRYTDKIILQLAEVPDPVFERIENSISLLEEGLDLGTPYEPAYPYLKPSIPCWRKYVPGTYKEIFFVKDEKSKELVLLCLTDTRADPLSKLIGPE